MDTGIPGTPSTPPLASLPVPDYMEPIVAWRTWGINGNLLSLSSLGKTLWKPYQMLEAHHHLGFPWASPVCKDSPCDAGPYPSCGLYGMKSAELLKPRLTYHSGSNIVIGEIYLWGRMYEHENGYRAQYGYPKRFVYVNGCDGPMLAKTYGIPYEEDISWKSVFHSDASSSSHWFFPSLVQVHYPIMSARVISPSSNLSNAPWPSQSILPPEKLKLIRKPANILSTPSNKEGRLCRPRHWFKQNRVYRRVNVNQWLEAKAKS